MESRLHDPLMHDHVSVGVTLLPGDAPLDGHHDRRQPVEEPFSPEEVEISNAGAPKPDAKGKASGKRTTCATKSLSACLLFGVALGVAMAVFLPSVVQSQVDQNVNSNDIISSVDASGYMQFMNHSYSSENVVKFFFFNIANPNGVLQGEKPRLEEIGPFIYNQYQMRYNITWNDADDTVSYAQHTWIEFDPIATSVATNGKYNSSDVQIISINLLFLGMKAKVGPLFWHLITDLLLWKDDYNRLFATKTVNEYVLGYSVDLSVVGIDVPIEFPGLMANVKLEEDPQYTSKQTMTVGNKDISKVYQLSRFVGKPTTEMSCPWSQNTLLPELSSCSVGQAPCCNPPGQTPTFPAWGTEYVAGLWDADANLVHGTNGEQFHPNVQKSDKLIVFNDVANRAIQFENVDGEEVVVKGITLYRFQPSIDFIQNAVDRPGNDRYFKFGPTGVVNMTALQQGADIHISYPHFLYGDKELLLDKVDGLSPDPDKHRLIIDVEPNTGQTLQQHSRVQINARIERVSYSIEDWFPEIQDNTYVPVAWFEINSLVNDDAATELKQIYLAHTLQSGSLYGGIGLAVLCALVLTVVVVRQRQ